MRFIEDQLVLSPTDLVGHIACEHLTQLELKAARGEVQRPDREDPELDVLTNRGSEHERQHLERLRSQGLEVVEIALADFDLGALANAETETASAMRAGVPVIYQGSFFDGRWHGRPDFLIRVDGESDLGPYRYEAADTKLARRVRPGALLQLCAYSDQLARVQGVEPVNMHVVLGGPTQATYAVADFAAYYRTAKARLEGIANAPAISTYPDPVEHCALCRWTENCSTRRQADDHLSLVANMRRDQTKKMNLAGIPTVVELANSSESARVDGMEPATFAKLRRQARMQVGQRASGEVACEVIETEFPHGLWGLPEPSPGDLFFDMEGDPFVGTDGLEYLFGVVERTGTGPKFHAWWAHDGSEEKAAFEGFVDFVMDRWEKDPKLHVYHYAAYEPSRLKRLMGFHATREEEVDRLLRAGVLVDLYRVVREGIVVSQESYSIKKLEPLYGFGRAGGIADAVSSVVAYEQWLETSEDKLLVEIEEYNEQDCISTLDLRDWLEGLRAERVRATGGDLGRPEPWLPVASEQLQDAEEGTTRILRSLTAAIPAALEERSDAENAAWLLGNLLGFHKREAKSDWWDYFRRLEMSDDELATEDRDSIGGLTYEGPVAEVGRSTVHRYRFDPAQEHKILIGDSPEDPRTHTSAGSVFAIDSLLGTVDLKRGNSSKAPHPTSLIPQRPRSTTEQRRALERVATWVAQNGIEGPGPWKAGRDLLLRRSPTVDGWRPGEPLVAENEKELDAVRRMATRLHETCLPIQGPPGSGKTYSAARMIVDVAAAGRRVGVAAPSHKAIGNLIDAICDYAVTAGVTLRVIQKAPDTQRASADGVDFTGDNSTVEGRLSAGTVDIVGGTSWLFSREQLTASLDTLYVDEAGQMSLADVVAMSGAAANLVLLGDPQQLAQPTAGSHPAGSGASALEHALDGAATIDSTKGVFLSTTWRMHPTLARFVSDVAYDGRLVSEAACAEQTLIAPDDMPPTGILYLPVEHSGNRSWSVEEAAQIAAIYAKLATRQWRDRAGSVAPLSASDVLVVTPYNAQAVRLAAALPAGARVGTVDRFQGQEAAVVFYSTGTSAAEDVPRGMEFLYSLNRLNVAVSRAKVLAVLVCSPRLLEARCRNPEQMRLVNAFCMLAERGRAPSRD